MKIEIINTIIKNRRSVYPPMYNDKEIPKDVIEQILENANWAPTHRKTEPWRFKVFRGESLQKLSDYLGQYYKKNTPQEKYSDFKYKRTTNKPLQSSAVIAICMERNEVVPEEEEIAAVAMAVQNMWLTCSAYGIGSYWSSPKSAYHSNDFLQLASNQRCLGFFYMGYYDATELDSERGNINDKVEWL